MPPGVDRVPERPLRPAPKDSDENQYNIATMDPAQVAMKCFGGIEKMAATSRGCKSCRNLLADETGLAHTRHDHVGVAVVDVRDCLRKICIQSICQLPQCGSLEPNDFAGVLYLLKWRERGYFVRASGCGSTRCFHAHRFVILDIEESW